MQMFTASLTNLRDVLLSRFSNSKLDSVMEFGRELVCDLIASKTT